MFEHIKDTIETWETIRYKSLYYKNNKCCFMVVLNFWLLSFIIFRYIICIHILSTNTFYMSLHRKVLKLTISFCKVWVYIQLNEVLATTVTTQTSRKNGKWPYLTSNEYKLMSSRVKAFYLCITQYHWGILFANGTH